VPPSLKLELASDKITKRRWWPLPQSTNVFISDVFKAISSNSSKKIFVISCCWAKMLNGLKINLRKSSLDVRCFVFLKWKMKENLPPCTAFGLMALKSPGNEDLDRLQQHLFLFSPPDPKQTSLKALVELRVLPDGPGKDEPEKDFRSAVNVLVQENNLLFWWRGQINFTK